MVCREVRISHTGRAKALVGERPMGTATYGGRGFKGRARVSGEANGRQQPQTSIHCRFHAKPPPPHRPSTPKSINAVGSQSDTAFRFSHLLVSSLFVTLKSCACEWVQAGSSWEVAVVSRVCLRKGPPTPSLRSPSLGITTPTPPSPIPAQPRACPLLVHCPPPPDHWVGPIPHAPGPYNTQGPQAAGADPARPVAVRGVVGHVREGLPHPGAGPPEAEPPTLAAAPHAGLRDVAHVGGSLRRERLE